jgi:protein SCO1/2
VKLTLVLPLVLLLAGCGAGPMLPSYGVVPDFSLTDQSGRTFDSRSQLDGKVWVANFIFTTCAGPCPRMTSQLRQIRDEASNAGDLRLVSFTIDPARDTPAALAEYGKRFGADPDRWFFLTGPMSDLNSLSRKTFMLGNVDGSLEHSTRFVLIDRKGRIRGFYDSSDREKIQQLTADIGTLLKDRA